MSRKKLNRPSALQPEPHVSLTIWKLKSIAKISVVGWMISSSKANNRSRPYDILDTRSEIWELRCHVWDLSCRWATLAECGVTSDGTNVTLPCYYIACHGLGLTRCPLCDNIVNEQRWSTVKKRSGSKQSQSSTCPVESYDELRRTGESSVRSPRSPGDQLCAAVAVPTVPHDGRLRS